VSRRILWGGGGEGGEPTENGDPEKKICEGLQPLYLVLLFSLARYSCALYMVAAGSYRTWLNFNSLHGLELPPWTSIPHKRGFLLRSIFYPPVSSSRCSPQSPFFCTLFCVRIPLKFVEYHAQRTNFLIFCRILCLCIGN
jgi:hypothetical protein